MLLKKGLFLSEENVTNLEYIQRQTAMIFSLLAFVLLLVLGISDVFLGMPLVIVWIKFVIALPFLASYFLISKYGNTQLTLNILLVLAHVVICFNFIYNGGNDGPTIYAFFLMLVVTSLLMEGVSKLLWFIGSLTIFFLLFYAEVAGYITVENYYSGIQNQFIDHTVTIGWISFFVFTSLHFFIKSYKNQNQTLHAIKLRQDHTLGEVKMLNDQKNRLIAILTHDLKNPIGMLNTTLGLVEEDAFEEGELEQILSNLKDQTFHLNKVLENTLSWVMTELEDSPIQRYEISLMELTQEVKEMMEAQAKEKNQIIEVSIKGEDRNISLEINEIKIILKNLLDNAIKFSPLNSPINLDLITSDSRLSWEVRNRGKTISQADQKELFSFQARTSYGTKKEKGTGVGLALCKRIADKINFDLSYTKLRDGHNCFTLSKKLS